MTYVTEKKFNNTHTDYKGVFENLQNHEEMQHLVGKRTFLLPNNGGLAIESSSIEIVENFERDLTMKNGEVLIFSYTDDWCRPVFVLTLPSGKKREVVFLEEGIRNGKPMHSLSDWGEPECPLKEEYQVEVVA